MLGADGRGHMLRRIFYATFNVLAFFLLASLGIRFVLGQTSDFGATGPAAVVLAAAAVSAFVGNIERFELFKASAAGIEAKMHEVDQLKLEARVTINEFHALAEMTATLLLQQITSGGRFGGQSAAQKDQQRTQLLDTLKKIGLTQEAINRVDSSDAVWTRSDYAHAVMQSIEASDSCGPALKESISAMRDRWNTENFRPEPSDFDRLLQQAQCNDPKVRERLEDRA